MRTSQRSVLSSARTAAELDRRDELAGLRRRFEMPRIEDRPATYLCGHSLGLMPKRARTLVDAQLKRWSDQGVEGHFGDGGWFDYHRQFAAPLARMTGARHSEVVAMNSLTVNLHLLLCSFFRPAGKRRKILIEAQAFPSDRYAVASQLQLHGIDPHEGLVELQAADPAVGIVPADLHAALAQHRDEIALILLPGVQYLSGQVLDIETMTRVAHASRCVIGFDLAHAIGNVRLKLHDWGPDFAVWCSYKYLNAGPGAIGGAFVHNRHGSNRDLVRPAGWWGHSEGRRFLMEHDFDPMVGAEGWQLSNPPILAMAPLRASLDVFAEAGQRRLQRKSAALSGFVLQLIDEQLGDAVSVVTPRSARGAQVSVRLRSGDATQCAAELRTSGIIVDVRRPDILRIAPVPLYNRFAEVQRTIKTLARILQ